MGLKNFFGGEKGWWYVYRRKARLSKSGYVRAHPSIHLATWAMAALAATDGAASHWHWRRLLAHSALNVATLHGVGGSERRQLQIGKDATEEAG